MIHAQQPKRGNIITDLMPDLTPLLDVMFMLILFFILTANAVPFTLDVHLPEDDEEVSQAIDEQQWLRVTLLPQGQGWKIDDQLYAQESAFKEALKAKATSDQKVLILGDKEVSMQTLLSLMVFLRKHQIEMADIVMEQK